MVLIRKLAKNVFVFSSFISSFWGFLLISCFFILEWNIFLSLIISLTLSTSLLFFGVKKSDKNTSKKKKIIGFFDPGIIRLFSMAWIFFALKTIIVPVLFVVIVLYVVSKSYFKKLNFKYVLINSCIGIVIGFLSFYLVSLLI